jgi:hypothetical protein
LDGETSLLEEEERTDERERGRKDLWYPLNSDKEFLCSSQKVTLTSRPSSDIGYQSTLLFFMIIKKKTKKKMITRRRRRKRKKKMMDQWHEQVGL